MEKNSMSVFSFSELAPVKDMPQAQCILGSQTQGLHLTSHPMKMCRNHSKKSYSHPSALSHCLFLFSVSSPLLILSP